jgi:nicotinamidase-related amidase
MSGSGLRIESVRTALLVIDVQQRLWDVMPADKPRVARNLGILVELARRLGIPVVMSEQYPQGLGRTIPEVAEAVAAPGVALHRLEKLEFSCAAAPAFAPIWDELARDTWIVAGMETHICVYQTARDLAARGATVHLAADAVISRTAENRATGLELIARAGGIVTSTETVVFDALQRAGSEDFRALSRLVR